MPLLWSQGKTHTLIQVHTAIKKSSRHWEQRFQFLVQSSFKWVDEQSLYATDFTRTQNIILNKLDCILTLMNLLREV